MSNFKYSLGTQAKDKITGYAGTLVARTEWIHGCARYTIQAPVLKDGFPVEAYTMDEDAIEITGEPAKDVEPNFEYELGAVAEDTTTTYQGVVYGRTQWLNGDTVYNLQAKTLHNGVPAKQWRCTEGVMSLIAEAPSPVKYKETGGPLEATSRF
jgi:hypothetical protein